MGSEMCIRDRGYTVLCVGIVRGSIVEVRVGICGFIVNRCVKSSLCEGDIDVQKGDCSFGDDVCEADCRVCKVISPKENNNNYQ